LRTRNISCPRLNSTVADIAAFLESGPARGDGVDAPLPPFGPLFDEGRGGRRGRRYDEKRAEEYGCGVTD